MTNATNLAQAVIDRSDPERDAGPVTWAHVNLARAVMALEQRIVDLERGQSALALKTYTLSEAAKLLGVSLPTVNRMTADGTLPVVRLTGEEGRPRIRHTDLLRLLEAS